MLSKPFYLSYAIINSCPYYFVENMIVLEKSFRGKIIKLPINLVEQLSCLYPNERELQLANFLDE